MMDKLFHTSILTKRKVIRQLMSNIGVIRNSMTNYLMYYEIVWAYFRKKSRYSKYKVEKPMYYQECKEVQFRNLIPKAACQVKKKSCYIKE